MTDDQGPKPVRAHERRLRFGHWSLVIGLYNLLFVPVFLLLLPGYLLRMVRRGGWRRGFGQRLGRYAGELRSRLAAETEGRIWIQAVSVGEMFVALKLLRALRERAPGRRFLLSTTTTTGFALALPHAGPDLEVLYTPVDFPLAARWAWRDLRPAALVVIEGGLWPNLLAQARRASRPVFLVNARLSPRSERRFQRGRALAAPALFDPLTALAAPEPGDVARWASVGVSREKVRVVGNLKFDDEAAPVPAGDTPRSCVVDTLAAAGWPVDDASRPLLLLASTHPGEEILLAGLFQSLREVFPTLRLAVAPRHVERARGVENDLRSLGLRVVRRTALTTSAPDADVLLLDTTGELRDVLPLATVVVMGKCWRAPATGGQNPAEPLAAGRPVVVGPHMENFAEITAALLAAGALVQVSDAADVSFQEALRGLLADATARKTLVDRAAAVLTRHRGAAGRTADLILGGLSSPSRPPS